MCLLHYEVEVEVPGVAREIFKTGKKVTIFLVFVTLGVPLTKLYPFRSSV